MKTEARENQHESGEETPVNRRKNDGAGRNGELVDDLGLEVETLEIGHEVIEDRNQSSPERSRQVPGEQPEILRQVADAFDRAVPALSTATPGPP